MAESPEILGRQNLCFAQLTDVLRLGRLGERSRTIDETAHPVMAVSIT